MFWQNFPRFFKFEMPVIASAKKCARQDAKKRVRNHAFLSNMRSLFKNIIKHAEKGEIENIEKFFSEAQSAIDKCVKKNLIHKNNAARKKARIAKIVAELEKKGKKAKIAKVNKAAQKPVKKTEKTEKKPAKK